VRQAGSRSRMSSIMRWRNGLTVCVDWAMGLLLSQNEVGCLIPQHRKQSLWLSEPPDSDRSTHYRASGLVPRPLAVKGKSPNHSVKHG